MAAPSALLWDAPPEAAATDLPERVEPAEAPPWRDDLRGRAGARGCSICRPKGSICADRAADVARRVGEGVPREGNRLTLDGFEVVPARSFAPRAEGLGGYVALVAGGVAVLLASTGHVTTIAQGDCR